MKRKYVYSSFIILASVVFIASCKKDYLDVNKDPNNPTTATVDLVLPTALGYSAYNIGNPYQILGGLWGQFWTQGPTASQYKALDQYSITSTNYDRQWINVYAGPLNDFKYIVDQGLATDRKAYAGIGRIMQAYMFQVMTDLQGDIPFSEALNANGGNTKPVFDSQDKVYDGLISLVDEGLSYLDDNDPNPPGNDDFFYKGDVSIWRKFGNTLKLKIYLREAYVRPDVAEAGIKAMYTANDEFLGLDEDAFVPFITQQFNQNPLFATFQALTTSNLLASNTALNYFRNNNDPRINIFYTPATASPNTGNQAGIDQGNGANLGGNQNANSFSKPGPAIGGPITIDDPNGGADAPVIFLSAAESYFLQAEAIARGWGTGNAEEMYQNGIAASLLFWGLSEDDVNTYLAQPAIAFPGGGSVEQQIKAIITQKWASMDGTENIEAWTEWRRTGYPDFFVISKTSSIGNKFPVRILYPDSEVASNPNTPPQKTVSDKVWWDVNTTGQN